MEDVIEQKHILTKSLNPKIWMPSFFFFLRSVAHGFPDTPNRVTKRKYYDFVMNIPMYVPSDEWINTFTHLLDVCPITPYLDSRDAFFMWIHMLENKVNLRMNLPNKTIVEHYDQYYGAYLPQPIYIANKFKLHKNTIITGITLSLLLGIVYVSSL